MVLDRFRRRRRYGKSGQYLVAFGLAVLVGGLFTDGLGTRVALGGVSLTVLELGVLGLGVALARMLVRALLRKLKRGLLKGALAGGSLGIGLPALPALGVALPAVPYASRLARRLPTGRIARRLPWFGTSRLERLRRAVGGRRGLGTGGVGTTLVLYGARTDSLGESYVVFGNRLDLLGLFVLLAVPGALVYAVRNW